MLAQKLRLDARAISRADDGADRCARNRGRRYAEFVKRLQKGDVRDPARPAAAKRDTDRKRSFDR